LHSPLLRSPFCRAQPILQQWVSAALVAERSQHRILWLAVEAEAEEMTRPQPLTRAVAGLAATFCQEQIRYQSVLHIQLLLVRQVSAVLI